MPELTSQTTAKPPTSSAPPTPRPQSPIDGRTVDGRMAEFHWSAHPGAEVYRLQISRNESFESLHVDFTVEDTTVTELSGLLPINGSTWYWRVRAENASGNWSDPAQFIAGRSADEEGSSESGKTRSKSTNRSASTRTKTQDANEEVAVPYQTAETSSAWAAMVGLIMVLSFIITMVFIAMAV